MDGGSKMTEINSKIIEKIKKLLELTTSSNENEAQRAMEAAMRLMEKYSINYIEDIDVKEKILKVKWWPASADKRGLIEQVPAIVAIISPIFGVHGIILSSGSRVKQLFLVGYPANIEIAKFAIDSIINQAIIEARIEYKKYRSTLFNYEFYTGYVEGLRKKFAKSSSDSQSITVYDPIKQYVADNTKGSFAGESFNGDAINSGIEAGLRAELRKGLNTSNTGKLLN